MRFPRLTLALALAAGAFALPAHAATLEATAFDAAVAGDIPSVFDLPYRDTQLRVAALERLDIAIEGPDGRPGAMYLARIDGRPATLVRLGDALDVAFDDENGGVARTSSGGARALARAAATDATDTYEPVAGPDELPEPDGIDDVASLDIWVYLHDNANENDHARFLNWYLTWWSDEMRRVVPERPVRVFLKDHVPGLSDMDYQSGDVRSRLGEIVDAGDAYLESSGMPRSNYTLHVLMVGPTGGNWGSWVYGVALDKGRAAMVSNAGARHGVAHEIGHMIGARHEDSSWFPCASSMAGYELLVVSCKRYTDANRANVRRYLLPRP